MVEHKRIRFFPYLIILYEIAVYLSNDMYLPSMPAIAKDLNFSQTQIQDTLTFWFLGASSMQLILGPISDRFGRKSVLIIGGILFVLSSILCAMSYSLPVMLTARSIQGTAICSLVAAYAAIHELYTTKQAIKLLALIGAITILAPALGPLFGALIVQFAHWRYIFWFLVLIGSVSVCSMIFYMPESNTQQHSLNIKHILRDYKKIILNIDFVIPCLAYCFLVAMYFIWIFESPFIMMEVFKTSPLDYGIAQAIIFGCYFIGAAATKWALEHFSVLKLVVMSTWLTIAGAVLFVLSSILINSIVIAIVCMVIISFGTSMLFGPINRIAMEACKQPMGRRTAVFSTNVSLFGALTGWGLALINSRTLSTISSLIIICMLIAASLIFKMKIPATISD